MEPQSDPGIDYYAVLGVKPTASAEEIKAAFRMQAQRRHPDHGGTDEDMKRILGAWSILSNPERRAAYDATRTGSPDPLTMQRWATTAKSDAADAERMAAEYPRKWGDFEPWLSKFLRDFLDAKYGYTEVNFHYFRMKLPTAEGSWSAQAFIWIGGLLGAILVIVFAFALGGPDQLLRNAFSQKPFNYRAVVGLFLLPVGIVGLGLKLGKWIHSRIRACLRSFINLVLADAPSD